MILGFIFSLIVSVLFAVYAIPRKYSNQNVILYTMWMGIAYFFFTIILISVIWGFGFEKTENLLNPWHLLTVLRGFIWVLGMAAYNIAIDKIGLTRFNQWKNIQGPVGSLLIFFVISDMTEMIKVIWLLLGMAVMFCSALLFQINDGLITPEGTPIKKNARLGIVFALLSGLCFGISALLNSVVSRYAIVGDRFTFAQLLYHSASLVLFSMLVYMIIGNGQNKHSTAKQRLKDIFSIDKKTILPFIAGIMFLAATLLTIYSYRMIPNAVAWSITQLNVFWTILAGVCFFKELSIRKHWFRISSGIILAVGACIFLFFAM